MKKPKIFSEFKEFITRGNVMGLAVGMIIGAAFTAIVNALVNSILKPLINWIPIGDMSGLITMLVPRDADGLKCAEAAADLTKSVYIDWGAVIMAIITFLLTALVLFFILKAITSVQKGFGAMKSEAELLSSEEYEELKKQGKSRKEIKAILAERAAAKKAEEEAKAAAEAAAVETTDDILKDIRALLKAQAAAAEKTETAEAKTEAKADAE